MAPPQPLLRQPTIRPLGVYQLHGLASLPQSEQAHTLLGLDTVRGYVVQINGATDDTTILNPYHAETFIDGTGLAVDTSTDPTTLWFCRDRQVFSCTWQDWIPQEFVLLPYPADGVAVSQSQVYVTCQKAGYIFVFDRLTGKQVDKFPAPGVGVENITVRGDELWISDRAEESIYCLDRQTGTLRLSLLTPFAAPTGLAFLPNPEGTETLYVVYASEEPYLRDNPNRPDNPLEITYRDRTFIHPLHFHSDTAQKYNRSNGYLLEITYVEELAPLDPITLENLEWRIALPAETHRQKVRQVEPIGLPFTEVVEDGQRVAVFQFPVLKPGEARLFGWKALIEVYGIKYQLSYADVEELPELSAEFQARYLVDDDELAMDTAIVREAAREAVGSETNILRKILKIRNFVYDRLSYKIQPQIDTPDVALARGTGSCGEYVGLLLALSRLNGIACRTVGRYKCPPHSEQQGVPLYPDYNHVWLEFYIPGFGWVPMESNPDDVIDRGPYPTRFFMGLPWTHVELGKGIRFETTSARDQGVRLGDLSMNHIRFILLGELQPDSTNGT
jgi:transglutaminase-like putative cysteine protease